ncbi:MAG: flippase [Phascolarctobacterium sp.]|nr:MAG: flippase [Phascolarctobacterium sp.]
MDELLKSKTISGLLWKFAERIGAQIISFVVSIILARLLNPSDYGVIAILLVFIALADVFVNAGFGNALIQKKDADDLDFSSVLYSSFLFSIVIYGVVFFSSPIISLFYDMPILESTLKVLAIRIPIAAINSVQQAYVSRNMQFQKFFYSTLSGTGISAIIGITLAYNGFGVWALVWQYLSNALVNTVVLFFVIDWRPKLLFSFNRLKSLFNYGWKLLLSSLCDTGYNSLNSLLIGKFYTPADLAYFDTGKKFPLVVVNNINASISSVLFPALALEQDEPEKVKAHTRKAIQISSYIMWPMMLGMAACADNIVDLVLTDKWLPAVPYLQIACIIYGLWPIHTANLQAINALGRSDIFLKLEIIKKIISITALLFSLQYGILVIALSGIISGVVSTFINAYPNKFLLKYSYFEQLKDILPSLFCAILMFFIVKIFNRYFVCEKSIMLIFSIIIGSISYIIFTKLLKLEEYLYLKRTVKDFFVL